MEGAFKAEKWEAHHWTELQALYHLAADAPSGQRTRLLQAATADQGLVQRVLNLLEMDSEDEPAHTDDPGHGQFIDGRVGPYRLVRLLGSGGLGAVYLAERLHGGAVRQYALKVLSVHAAGPEMQTRFLREQQLLALLQHANIPRMLDAGFTDTGRPYLVMEYIDGEAITAHCDAAAMTVRDRVRLMMQVCEAVAYAHRMLVVHLDLKPQNILVSRDGQAKLLDFGTSKLLEPELTLTTTVLATPAYASPEQLRNEPITTACDVYGLGAVLYELLCGSRPWGNSSPTLILEHALREDEPATLESAELTAEAATKRGGATPGGLKKILRGDLADIVARCLRNSPEDRYPSVVVLQEDLLRYLEGRPILARPRTFRYRAAKFIRRNRLPVAVAAVCGALIASSLTYAGWRQHQEWRAANRAIQMQQFMTRLFRLAHSGATGKPAATVGELLQVGETVLPSFISDPADLRAARMSIAESMYDDEDATRALPLLLRLREDAKQAGDLQVQGKADILASDVLFLKSDRLGEAESLANEAMAISHQRSISPELRTMITALYVQNKDGQGDRSPESMDLLRAAVEESERTHAPEDQTASAINVLALGLQARGHYPEALQYFDRTLAIYRKMPFATCDTAATLRYRGSVEEKLGKDLDALNSYRQSYLLQMQCAGPRDLGTLSAHAWLATELAITGHSQEAITAIEPELPLWRNAVGADSMHLRTPLQALAGAYLNVGRFADAEAVSREQLRVLQAGRTAKRSLNMATPERTLAAALAGQHRYQEALPWAEAAVADFPAVSGMAPGLEKRYTAAQRLLADVRLHLSESTGPR